MKEAQKHYENKNIITFIEPFRWLVGVNDNMKEEGQGKCTSEQVACLPSSLFRVLLPETGVYWHKKGKIVQVE